MHIVEFPVKLELDDGAEKDYGTFKAKVRDFHSSLQVEAKADSDMASQGVDPDTASDRLRSLYTLLATFAITCEEHPKDFNPQEIPELPPAEAMRFLTAYARGLYEAEERFRQGPEEAAQGGVGRPARNLRRREAPLADG